MMTGYSDTMVGLQGKLRFPPIRKPYLPDELVMSGRLFFSPRDAKSLRAFVHPGDQRQR
ncbi:MAG TPA: hypothetical protein VKB88_20155 [Bryobacteraceae bacterium]|nr:hypothetical protein [Bryobacteraceae bacterium]